MYFNSQAVPQTKGIVPTILRKGSKRKLVSNSFCSPISVSERIKQNLRKMPEVYVPAGPCKRYQ